MEYLKSFIIGSSGPVFFQYLALLALKDKNYYDYSFKLYSILCPLYFGIVNTISTYFGNVYNLSLEKRLLNTSLASFLFIFILNYFYSKNKYEPYKKYSAKDWLSYIILNGGRHLISFSVIIYLITKNFSKSWMLRYFIIGSSAINFLPTFFKVQYLDKQNKLNYDYRTFAVFEPFIQGFELLIFMWVLHKKLKISLFESLTINVFAASLLWFGLATQNKTYKYKTIDEWLVALLRVFITRLLYLYPMNYLLTKL